MTDNNENNGDGSNNNINNNVERDNRLWEEKNLTEQQMSCENKNELETHDIIQKTNPMCLNEECCGIGNQKKETPWFKNCPDCGKIQYYTSNSTWNVAIRENRLCPACRIKRLHAEKEKRQKEEREKVYIRYCPECGKILYYCSKKKLNRAIKNNSYCKRCARLKLWADTISGYNQPEMKIKQSKSQKLLRDNKTACYYKKEWKENMSRKIKNLWNTKESVYKTKEYKKLQSDIHKNLWKNPNYKCNSEKFRETQRINALKQVRSKHVGTGFNINACKFIDEIGRKFGYNFQHALNGNEVEVIGYLLDGYDKEKNIIFEYDEPKHEYPSQKNKDIKRQNRLIEHLNPVMFLRYSEKFNKLYDVISGKEIIWQPTTT